MSAPADMKLYEEYRSALLIINPVSGKRMILRHVTDVIRIFMDAGYAVTTMITAKHGDATEYAERYGGEFDLVVCTGGDGTLNETLTGLARAGVSVPLGYIPCGSTNDFAAAHNLSSDILEAARNIASGRITSYDIGSFGEQYFTYVAAFGAFSWLSYTTDQNLKNLLGRTAYVLDGIKDLSRIKPVHMKINADGIIHEGDYIFGAVCNSLSVAGIIELSDRIVNMQDGIFEVLLIRNPKTIAELEGIVRGLMNQDYSAEDLEFFHAVNISVENPPELDWTLDGECADRVENVKIKPIKTFLQLQG